MTELIADIVEAAIETVFLFLLINPRNKKHISIALSFTFSVFLISASTYILDMIQMFFTFDVFIYLLIMIIISELFLEGSHYEKIAKSALAEISISISALISMLIIPAVLKTSLVNTLAKGESRTRVLSLSLSKLIQLVVTIVLYLIEKKNRKTEKVNEKIEAVLMMAVTVCSDFAISIIGNTNETIRKVMILALIVSMLALNYFALRVVFELINREKEGKNFELFLGKIQSEVIRVHSEETNLEEMRKLRHEIRNEYLPVREMIRNQNYTEAEKELTRLIGDAEMSMKNFDAVNTGYKILDSILNYYIRKMNELGVKLDYKIEKLSLNSITEKEVCSIIVNLLKNSYEALEKNDNNNKTANIQLMNRRGGLMVLVSNSITESIIGKIRPGYTDKQDKKNHGFGLKTVESIVDKYDGKMQFAENEGIFTVKVLFFEDMKND